MDGHAFDKITKKLSTDTSRRRALKGLVGGALAFTGLRTGSIEARQCREVGKNCRSHAECCSQFCNPDTFQCAPAPPEPVTGVCSGPRVGQCQCITAGALPCTPTAATACHANAVGACIISPCTCRRR
jgi:hypothetical protein